MSRVEFERFCKQLDTSEIRIVDETISTSSYVSIDLSINNEELNGVDITSARAMAMYIQSHIAENGCRVAYGGYLETRNVYQRSAYFNDQIDPNDERNIHIGVDIWSDVGTKVLAALDGEVHSFANNTNHGDYGPTIILKHTFDKLTFYSLYGHLSMASIENLRVGETFKQGQAIGSFGDASVNGDYAPHVHFQLILDMQNYQGDYPGVCSKNTLGVFQENCPDPNLLLGLT